MNREHVALDIPPGSASESQSGMHLNRPRVYGVLAGPSFGKVGAIVMHPTSNFMGHYLLDPLAQKNIGVLALNSRYVNNDSVLLVERVIQDLGAGVRFMRSRFDTVFLIGNSGGGALVALYQEQAEKLSITHTPAGDPIEISPDDLPPADGIALMAAHLGRPHLMRNWIDASVTDERDPLSCDPDLDIYSTENAPPFTEDFVEQVRMAQKARHERITQYALNRLRLLRSLDQPINDEAMLIYRTYADPRFVDLTLDPNDRSFGGNRGGGNARAHNYGVNNLGRYSSLTSWLSQWSSRSRLDGPRNLANTTVPVLHLEYTADASIFPSDIAQWNAAAEGRVEHHQIKNGTHYLAGQSGLIDLVARLTDDWSKRLAKGHISAA